MAIQSTVETLLKVAEIFCDSVLNPAESGIATNIAISAYSIATFPFAFCKKRFIVFIMLTP
jgi:hypothetical protein